MLENINTAFFVVSVPIVCVYRLALSPFVAPEEEKTWRRVVFDAIYRWMVFTVSIPRIAYLLGSTEHIYYDWAKRNSMPTCVEDTGEGGKLLWIGSKRSDRVILYLHGGGFIMPVAEAAASFLMYIQVQSKLTAGLNIGVAMLDYTLIPDARFPVPLRQAVAAVNHLLSDGFKPENIIVMGDSAGANLTLQLLLHMIHPIEDIPRLPPGTKFKGAYLMSPWLDLLPRRSTQSYRENGRWDIITTDTLVYFGDRVLAGVTDDSLLPYIDTYFAAEGWYKGMEEAVECVLITAGGAECLRDDIVKFSQKLSKAHSRTKTVVDKYGLHNDPFFDFFAREDKVGELTPMILQWFIDGFST